MGRGRKSRRDQWTRLQVLRGATAALAGGVAAAAAAACGPLRGQGGAPAPGAAAKAPAQLEMFNQSGSQQAVEEWAQTLEPVRQRLPHVTFNVTGPTGGAQFLDKALALGAAGTPPDFTYSVTRNGPALVAGGLVQDMNVVVKRDKIDLTGVSQPVLDDFMWEGKRMALPYDPGYAFIRYNKNLFQQAGQPDPGQLWQEKKWNWDTFVTTAVAVTRTRPGEPDRWGFVVRTWEGDYLSTIRSLGGDTLNKDRTQLTLGDGPGIAALGKWAEMVTRYKASPPPDQFPGGFPAGFYNGQVAMHSTHPGDITTAQRFVRDSGSQLAWDVVPHPAPAGKRPVPVLFTNGLYLWKGTKHEATVIEVLKILMTPELMLRYGAVTGRDPARYTLIADHAKNLGIPGLDPKSYVKLHQELTNDVRGLPHGIRYLEWHPILQREILVPVAKGEKSPQEAVSAAAPQINAILARK